MMRMLSVLHRLLGTPEEIASLLDGVLERSGRTVIVDLCSGDGGPIPDVMKLLHDEYERKDTRAILTDLYPNVNAATRFRAGDTVGVEYRKTPVDARTFRMESPQVRTMICSFHHLRPDQAQRVLQCAADAREPILIYEISDNSFPPIYLWWIGLPLNFLFGMAVSVLTRPMCFRQFVFTFLVPVIPACFAWDGAVSNARTYTTSDLEELLRGFDSTNYVWAVKTIKGRPTNRLCLTGMPEEGFESPEDRNEPNQGGHVKS